MKIKLLKDKGKEKPLKTVRKKRNITFKVVKTDFSIETMEA